MVHLFIYDSVSATSFYLNEPGDLKFRPPVKNRCFKGEGEQLYYMISPVRGI